MRIMNNKKMKSLLFCMMLIVAMAFTTVGCNKKESASEDTAAVVQETVESTTESSETEEAAVEVLGEGETKFLFTVVDKDGNETNFEIHTDKKIVGEVLMELGLISGEESQYGLYVKTVNGITLDYDKDGKYWAFYIGGEYSMSGVDTTEITAGSTYTFKAE